MNFRYYVYGVLPDGQFEFITTELVEDRAVDFAKRHKSAFGDRYIQYSVMTMNNTTTGPEVLEICRV